MPSQELHWTEWHRPKCLQTFQAGPASQGLNVDQVVIPRSVPICTNVAVKPEDLQLTLCEVWALDLSTPSFLYRFGRPKVRFANLAPSKSKSRGVLASQSPLPLFLPSLMLPMTRMMCKMYLMYFPSPGSLSAPATSLSLLSGDQTFRAFSSELQEPQTSQEELEKRSWNQKGSISGS